jgi:hypothetical protein
MTLFHPVQTLDEGKPGREKTMQPKLAECYIVLPTPFWMGKEQL